MLFTLSDIQSHFCVELFGNGKLLFEQDCVVNLRAIREGGLLTAVIKTPQSQSFRVYIRLQKKSHELIINGECSCDARQNCEHVVAILLKRLFDEKLLPEEFTASVLPPAESASSLPNKTIQKTLSVASEPIPCLKLCSITETKEKTS